MMLLPSRLLKLSWLIVLLALSPFSSHAATNYWKELKTDRGCIYYEWVGTDGGGWNWKKISWTGSCNAGEPISGTGTITLMAEMSRNDGFWVEYNGVFANGVPSKAVRFRNEQFPDTWNRAAFNGGCVPSDPSHEKCRPKQASSASSGSGGSHSNAASSGPASGRADFYVVKSFGNGCGVVEAVSREERSGRVFDKFRFRNSCKTAQLMELIMGPTDAPLSRPIGTSTNSLTRVLWPEETVPRPPLPFVPFNQLGSAMLLNPGGTYEFEVYQPLPAKPYGYKVASCDYAAPNGAARAVFRDASLDIDFICTVIRLK